MNLPIDRILNCIFENEFARSSREGFYLVMVSLVSSIMDDVDHVFWLKLVIMYL